jgi:hypothetical protein
LIDEDKLMEALRNPRKAASLVKELSAPTSDHSDLTTVGSESDGANKFSSK